MASALSRFAAWLLRWHFSGDGGQLLGQHVEHDLLLATLKSAVIT